MRSFDGAMEMAADERRRPEGHRSGRDAAVTPCLVGVGGEWAHRGEVSVALDAQAHRAAQRGEFGETHVAEFGTAEAEIGESEQAIVIEWIDLGEEPGRCGVWREELDDRHVIALVLAREPYWRELAAAQTR